MSEFPANASRPVTSPSESSTISSEGAPGSGEADNSMSSAWAARLAPTACPLLGVAAWSGTGKTTLLEQLLPKLRERGLKVAVIKHAHHAFDVDVPGKDSHRLRMAGAVPMLVASAKRFALMMETPEQQEADLEQLVAQLDSLEVDLILVEGFKQWPLPKLELYRSVVGKPLRVLEDRWIHALATPGATIDVQDTLPVDLKQLDLDDIETLAAWVSAWPIHWRLEGGQPRREVTS